MRLELAERLRCPGPHAATPLIVVAQRTAGRELLAALLGCPVCRLEARVVDGDVRFDDAAAPRATDPAARARPEAMRTESVPELERVVALLGLAEPEGAVLLTGRYAALAGRLATLTGVHVVVMHAEGMARGADAQGATAVDASVSAVEGCAAAAPFSDATFRGVALDRELPAAFVADAVRATALGGRVLAAAGVPRPAGLEELARDDTEWVAARASDGAIVELKRRV